MLWGWARDVVKKIEQTIVIYRSPCGCRLRNMNEVHQYLGLTGSQLGVDLFSFDCRVECFKQFQPSVICASVNGNKFLGSNNFCLLMFAPSRHHEGKRERSSFFCQLNWFKRPAVGSSLYQMALTHRRCRNQYGTRVSRVLRLHRRLSGQGKVPVLATNHSGTIPISF